ncbi:hypothetical protein CVT26_004776 [Gymnopilus dilepis]|uniref:Terminase ATPase subunit N-terminal domain-containing protein n=1 Tax=Gymnopilus dilepis TaxID=231916 RepID=A0A409XZJ7_9AGAR|nr:hypothetical protein CVT26_004776 [Gymnopilus dilepis]
MAKRKISPDLKECAIRLGELGWDVQLIAETLCVSPASVYRWRNIFEEIQSVTRPSSGLAGRLLSLHGGGMS